MAFRISLLLFLVATATGADAAELTRLTLQIEAQPPRTYAYRNTFGETEHYLVSSYRLSNPGERPLRYRGLPVTVTIESLVLNDGFRPLVQAAFCRRVGCETGIQSTAELQGILVPPRHTIAGIAIFQVHSGEWPQRLHMRAGTGSEVELQRTASAGYASSGGTTTADEPTRTVDAAPSVKEPPTVTASRPNPGRPEEAPRSWRVVHSAIHQPSGSGR